MRTSHAQGMPSNTIFLIRAIYRQPLDNILRSANHTLDKNGEALIATASGLTVAIIAYIFHRFLRGKIQNLAVELEREAADLLDALETPAQTAPAPAPVARAAPQAAR